MEYSRYCDYCMYSAFVLFTSTIKFVMRRELDHTEQIYLQEQKTNAKDWPLPCTMMGMARPLCEMDGLGTLALLIKKYCLLRCFNIIMNEKSVFLHSHCPHNQKSTAVRDMLTKLYHYIILPDLHKMLKCSLNTWSWQYQGCRVNPCRIGGYFVGCKRSLL